MKQIFTPKDVARLIGISYRQIQYWDKTNFIRPSHRSRGKYRQYSFADLMLMRVAKMLRDRAVSIQRLRKVIKLIQEMLPKTNCALPECHLLIDGERILLFGGDVIMDPSTAASMVHFEARSLSREIREAFPQEESQTVGQAVAKV